jgi:hypothetical protein
LLKEMLSSELKAASGAAQPGSLRCCFGAKPNLKYRGFVGFTHEEFRTSVFAGDERKFLHHMVEQHMGETIALTKVEGRVVANPRLATMHSSQFFTGAHADQTQALADCNSRLYHTHVQRGNVSEMEAEKNLEMFLEYNRGIANTVYQPVDSGNKCQEVSITYHSLPSLILECHKDYPLLEIYTFFCVTSPLTSKQPHTGRGGRPGRKQRSHASRQPQADSNGWLDANSWTDRSPLRQGKGDGKGDMHWASRQRR